MRVNRAVLRLTPVLVGLLAAGTFTAVRASSATVPLVDFTVLNTSTAVRRGPGEPVYLYDLGFYAVAHETVEIRTHRGASYSDPIAATLSVGEGAERATTDLPANITTNPGRLTSFFDVKVSDARGQKVRSSALEFCPNSYGRSRVEPDAAAQSPYPRSCGGSHPFALGSVLGITKGWSTPVLGDYESPLSFEAPDGTYTVKIAVARPWREVLGLTLEQATSQVTVKVSTYGTSTARSSAEHSQHMHHTHPVVDEARLSPQTAALEAARKRALGVPNVPAPNPPTGRVDAFDVNDAPKADLRSLPAYDISREVTGRPGQARKTYLNFGATVWNAGPSPLVVDGFRKPGQDVLEAYQYFFDAEGNQVGHAPAGEMQWDPRNGHNHWHFKDFASYRLLDSTRKKAIISGKEAFCLAPTDAIDLTVDDAQWRPASTDLDTACGQSNKNLLSIREVLESGWGDTYGQYLPGQSFDITRVPGGTYYVETLANPERRLTESDYDNNSALRKVAIGGPVGGVRTIKVYPYEGVKR
ncbi:lysyl oxidase family protein [Kineosporia succinea]|uniref:Lysyl oxidase n=1 Tax=Kineosporia succinea TaxID=84632 RepID=A0ABT9NXB1_9ACTN|nr:lysyl oxidase family protein [Kineosporia succinea]MDP9825066.1 hypothetical protein [Kineosporia succinea]